MFGLFSCLSLCLCASRKQYHPGRLLAPMLPGHLSLITSESLMSRCHPPSRVFKRLAFPSVVSPSRALPLCVVGLPPAGHRVADTRAGSRVHVLHHDEGMFLQRGHSQVTIIRHLVQEAAVAGPDRVAHLKDPSSVRAHLEGKEATLCGFMNAHSRTSSLPVSVREKSITLTVRPNTCPFACCKADRTGSDTPNQNLTHYTEGGRTNPADDLCHISLMSRSEPD